MIKANELRIGNWVNAKFMTDDFNFQAKGILDEYALLKEKVSYHETTLHGIPLTPEILEKAGFEKATIENSDLDLGSEISYITHFARKRLVLEFVGNEPNIQINTHWVENVGMAEVSLTYDIKYLHELQNLYFALFGEELTIEL